MLDTPPSIVPPAPAVHPKDLPPIRLLLGSIRNSLSIWPDRAFEIAFNRNTLFGVESVLINNPSGVRYMMATNAANYARPAIMPRLVRPLIGRGLFLAEGGEWRRQRRQLSPSFTPNQVNILLPHFIAAANDLIHQLEGQSSANLSDAYQIAALNAVLRALFSMPDQAERDRIGDWSVNMLPGRDARRSSTLSPNPRHPLPSRWGGAAPSRSAGSRLSMRSSPPAAARRTVRAIKTCSIS